MKESNKIKSAAQQLHPSILSQSSILNPLFDYVIVGLGKTGWSCVEYCLNKGFSFAVTDSRENPPFKEQLLKLDLTVSFSFGKLDLDLILKAKTLMVSPGVSLNELAIQEAQSQGIPCVGDIELFVKEIDAPIIAVTGSNAKSTVTQMVFEMAASQQVNVMMAGNIGIPVLELLQKPTCDLYVLELSSFQLETTPSLRTKAAAILNISEDHMDRYDDMNAYIKAKQLIYLNCDTAVYNRHDPHTFPQHFKGKTISFGLDEPSEGNFGLLQKEGNTYLALGKQCLFDVKDMSLPGRHNLENALAALALIHAVNIEVKSCSNRLKIFKGLPHRCQLVRKKDDVLWIDDSKGTNVGAVIAALKGLGSKKNIILLAGGKGKGADFTPLREAVSDYVKEAILFGEASNELKDVLTSCCCIKQVSSFSEAINYANEMAKASDIVLLSPACASFDMFKNYEHRGEMFAELVNQL